MAEGLAEGPPEHPAEAQKHKVARLREKEKGSQHQEVQLTLYKLFSIIVPNNGVSGCQV